MRHGKPLDDKLRTQLKTMVQRYGEKGTADLLECNRGTITRAIAGCQLNHSTAFMIEAMLRDWDERQVRMENAVLITGART